jgi:integrase
MAIEQSELQSFEAWLLRYGRGQDTADQYVKCVRLSFEGRDPLHKLTDKDLSPKYLRLIKSSLSAYADYSDDPELASDLKRMRLPPPKRRKDKVPLTETEWSNLREEISEASYLQHFEPMRAGLNMLVCRGFRVADMLRIKRKEVSDALRRGVLDCEGKGRKRLRFTVADYWADSLETFDRNLSDWERVEDLICPRSAAHSRRASASKSVSRSLKKCGRFVGLDAEDVHPHLLRHTYATLFYNMVKDPAKLQAHMQWDSIEVAMGYVNAGNVEELDEIAGSLFA